MHEARATELTGGKGNKGAEECPESGLNGKSELKAVDGRPKTAF